MLELDRLTHWNEVMEVMGVARESRNNPLVDVPGGTVKEIYMIAWGMTGSRAVVW